MLFILVFRINLIKYNIRVVSRNLSSNIFIIYKLLLKRIKPEIIGYENNVKEKIELTGITFHYANMLRRVLKSYIPTYAFPINQIKITKNSSIVDNDQVRERLANMAIMYINNNEDTVKHFLDYYDGKSEKENFFSMFMKMRNYTTN